MNTPARAVTAAVVGALAVAAAIPALTGAQSNGAREITVLDKVRSARFVHANHAVRGERLATGDRVLTRQALVDQGRHPVGTLFTDCSNVGRAAPVFKATLQCTSTYSLRGGQIVSAGVVRLSQGPGAGFPIVGGSGAYRGAKGEVTTGAPVKGFDSVDVLHLDG